MFLSRVPRHRAVVVVAAVALLSRPSSSDAPEAVTLRTGGNIIQLGDGTLTTRPLCPHCVVDDALQEFLKDKDGDAGVIAKATSTIHVMWPTYIENFSITSDIGGWEKPKLHLGLADAIVAGWREFRKDFLPSINADHQAMQVAAKVDVDDANRLFYAWQVSNWWPVGGNSTTWPELEALPQYRRIRKVVDKLSRRYLERTGLGASRAQALNLTVRSWAAVQRQKEFMPLRTALGYYHAGVFFARAGPSSGKLRFYDPRGHSDPFGREFVHSPRSGELFLFPCWLGHGLTVEEELSDLGDDEPSTVAIFFNVGPVDGPIAWENWWQDPISGMSFKRAALVDADLFKGLA